MICITAIVEYTKKRTNPEQSMLINILDAYHKPANLDKIVGKADNLNKEQIITTSLVKQI